MMKRVFHIICILILCAVGTAHAQTDPLFFQQTNNRWLINPASTGKGGDTNAGLTVRQQWIGFPGPSTQALFANGFVQSVRSGFGMSWIRDQFGPQSVNNVKLNYAHFIPFEEIAFLSLGLGMGVMNSIYDETGFFAQDGEDETLTMGVTSKTIPDFDFGFEFNTRYVELGASVSHISYGFNDQNLIRTMRNFFVYSRVKLPMNNYWDLIPGITWHRAYRLNNYEISTAFRYNNNISVNLIYRNPMNCGISLGANLFGTFRVIYSYDYGINHLSSYNSGSHEITLLYNILANTTYIKTKLRFFRWKMF